MYISEYNACKINEVKDLPEKQHIKKIKHIRLHKYAYTNKCGNIPSAPSYGVFISKLIRYARACRNYADFSYRARTLTTRHLQYSVPIRHPPRAGPGVKIISQQQC